jgi:hypothetical protein
MRTRILLAVLVVMVLLSAGCGAAIPASTKTPSPVPAPSPTATPLPTASAAEFATACTGGSNFGYARTTYYRLGDLLMSKGAYAGIPSRKLPDNTPLKPLLTPDLNDQPAIDAHFPPEPMVNPIGVGVLLTLCNASTTRPHELEGMTVRIDQFVPYAGLVEAWTECDGFYTRSDPHGVVGGGCGYAVAADETMKVSYPPSATSGTELAATWTGAGGPIDETRNAPFGPLPALLPPGQFLVVLLTGAPTVAGTYTLSVAPTVDQTRLPFVPVGSPARFSATPQTWTGEACLTQAMQSQIPAATTPPSYYICPKS